MDKLNGSFEEVEKKMGKKRDLDEQIKNMGVKRK